MHLKHSTLLGVAGSIWLLVGIMLMILGLNLLVNVERASGLFQLLTDLLGRADYASIALVVIALIVGRLKGRFVLSKSVTRMQARLVKLGEPLPIWKIYSGGFYILIAFMMGLGMLFRFFGVPQDIRGFVDVAVGAALLSGSTAYFNKAGEARGEKEPST